MLIGSRGSIGACGGLIRVMSGGGGGRCSSFDYMLSYLVIRRRYISHVHREE
jgi:hypothetical protein